MALYSLANPVRHAIAGPATIDDYTWSGWGAVIGRRARHSFESVDVILRLFGVTDDGARQNLRAALDEAIATKWRSPWQARLERMIAIACRAHEIARDAFSATSAPARAAQAEVARRAIRELGLQWRVVEAQLGIPRSRIARALRTGASCDP
jgi:hypothetical protein